MKDFIKINENDNVIVAIKELAEGEKVTVDGKEYIAAETIPAGHKMAICDIPQGGDVIKYGFRIGNAKENIKAGNGRMCTISKQHSAICSLIPTSR